MPKTNGIKKLYQIERNKEYKITAEFFDNGTARIRVYCPNGEKYSNILGLITNFEEVGHGADLMLNYL